MATGYSNRIDDPDKLKLERISGEGASLGCVAANPVMCKTCLNAMGPAPWADKPTKSYCLAYPREEGARKPPSVYYEGGPCQLHRPMR